MKKGNKDKASENDQKPMGLKERLFGLRGVLGKAAIGCREKSARTLADGQRECFLLQGKAMAFDESAAEIGKCLEATTPATEKTEADKAGT